MEPNYYPSVYGNNRNTECRAGCVAKSGGVTHNAGPVAMHNTVFGPEFRALWDISSEITIYSMF
jgi:hypothetical protein